LDDGVGIIELLTEHLLDLGVASGKAARAHRDALAARGRPSLRALTPDDAPADIGEAPAVGDEVSYAFNGDYYPCGTIKSISASFRLIITTEGQKFYRRRESACWKYNGVWSMVDGHREELNPHF
jgi:hypothetical protein